VSVLLSSIQSAFTLSTVCLCACIKYFKVSAATPIIHQSCHRQVCGDLPVTRKFPYSNGDCHWLRRRPLIPFNSGRLSQRPLAETYVIGER
jgi:hypothetical protein